MRKFFIKANLFTFLILLLFEVSIFSQSSDTRNLVHPVKEITFGFEMGTSLITPASVSKSEGNYSLHSRPMTVHSLGFNLIYRTNQRGVLGFGVHGVIGTTNYYAHIPDSDLPSGWDGRFLIWNRQIWGAIRIPLWFEQGLGSKKSVAIKGGVSMRYSGFMIDEQIGGTILLPGNQSIPIFGASFSSIKKPWLTFLVGITKPIVLKNNNILSIGLLADISTTDFWNGRYKITIPNQPVTSGEYSLNGSSFGLNLSYIITRSSKRQL